MSIIVWTTSKVTKAKCVFVRRTLTDKHLKSNLELLYPNLFSFSFFSSPFFIKPSSEAPTRKAVIMQLPQGTMVESSITTEASSPSASSSTEHASQNSTPTTPISEGSHYDTGDDYYQSPTFWYPRIHALCKTLWPEAKHEAVFLSQGTYNKIFSLSIGQDNGARHEEYVLKIPELEDMVLNTVGVLRYVKERIGRAETKPKVLKLPEVMSWDATKDNELRYPYTIEERLPGSSLGKCWDTLTQAQKISTAKQVALLYNDLTGVANETAGIVGIPAGLESKKEQLGSVPEEFVRVSAFGASSGGYRDHVHLTNTDKNITPSQFRCGPSGSPIDDMMLASLQRRMLQVSQRGSPITDIVEKHYKPLLRIVEELSEEGVFRSVPSGRGSAAGFCLSNMNLSLENTMIDFSDEDNLYITAILDWELPAFVPRFIAAEPPRWLWRADIKTKRWPECSPEPLDRKLVGADSAENEVIKLAFDEAVGADFCDRAYTHEFGFARRILKLSISDNWGQPEIYESEDIQSAWEAFCREDQTGLKEMALEDALAMLDCGKKSEAG